MSNELKIDSKDIATIVSSAPWLTGAQRAQLGVAKYQAGTAVALGAIDAGKVLYAEHQATRRHLASIAGEIAKLNSLAAHAADNRRERSEAFAQPGAALTCSPIERLREVVKAQENDNNMLINSRKR